MLIIFIGPPGAGKGTQSKRLVTHFDAVHLSTGEILRASMRAGTLIGNRAKDYINRGQLVPDDIVVQMIGERLSQSDCLLQGVLLDGFPRTLTQARALDAMLTEQDRNVDLVLALEVGHDELIRRLVDRGKHENRIDDSPETIGKRLEVYQQQTAPLIDYYRGQSVLREIDGTGNPDDVFKRVSQAVGSIRT